MEKTYYQKNKKKILERINEYNEKNKDKIKERLREKVKCHCGVWVARGSLYHHKRSRKHFKYCGSYG